MPSTSHQQPRTFQALEVVLIAVFVALATATVTLRQPQESFDDERPFRERYKGQKYSANAEEWLIRDFFKDRRGGVFVDVGANHYRDNSNTYFLETQRGWSGVAVDAQREFADGYVAHRPRTTFVTAFVSDRGGTVPLYIPKNNRAMASSDEPFVDYLDDVAEKREVQTATLTHILDTVGIDQFDLLSMDIEFAEPKALAGFEIARFVRPWYASRHTPRFVKSSSTTSPVTDTSSSGGTGSSIGGTCISRLRHTPSRSPCPSCPAPRFPDRASRAAATHLGMTVTLV
jgi:FkbM family methyltransferase